MPVNVVSSLARMNDYFSMHLGHVCFAGRVSLFDTVDQRLSGLESRRIVEELHGIALFAMGAEEFCGHPTACLLIKERRGYEP